MSKGKLIENRKLLLFILTYLFLLFIALIPIWLPEYLPLQDYPNHLARIHIINHIQSDPYLQKFYVIKFDIIPNLAIDILIPILSKLVALETAGKLVITLIIIMITSGCIFLNQTLFKSINFWSLTSFLLIFNEALIKGYMNFLLGVGLALWWIALWIGMRNRMTRIKLILFHFLSLLLFFCHLYAFGFYVSVIVSYELKVLIDSNRSNKAEFKKAASELLRLLSQFSVPLVLCFLSPTIESNTKLFYASIYTKLFVYPSNLLSRYNLFINGLTLSFLALVLILGIYQKRFKIANSMIFPICTLFIIYFCAPKILATSADADWRLLIPLSLLIACSIQFSIKEITFNVVMTTAIAVILLLNTYVITQKWLAFQGEYREILGLIENIETGSRIFATRSYSSKYEECYPFMHAPSYAAIRKSTFVASLFAFKTQQPLQFKEQYISVIQKASSYFCPNYRESIYQETNWNAFIKQYDYVLIGGRRLQNLPISLTEVSQGKNNILYKVKR